MVLVVVYLTLGGVTGCSKPARFVHNLELHNIHAGRHAWVLLHLFSIGQLCVG